ncbi:beta-1,6-N-acetylglucosaminyltransferase [Sediminicola luteus]|uniref:Peptide O-xylosyltransferase n=1 Tax=Sediminicola luteus TaxID=319238 RepID=A0A2A4G1N5_9FLAO|nr:beta-1,6-N-acetylglucosaminyltransferase [Sediminicola luteus]PCE62597.1 hypothetical protein B7P33_18365 [Sediminicola luteus]
MSSSHAYLIMAHSEPQALRLLLNLIDDERNHIYLHIDLSSNILNEENLKETCKKSKITFIGRQKVYWAGYSQIKVTLELLKKAINGSHDYYHLISGVDLPLKTQDELHHFFNLNKGQQFVSCGMVNTWKIASRYKYYHFEKLSAVMNRKLYRLLRYGMDFIQRLLLIDRTKKLNLEFYMGGNWFSITHDFSKYIVSQEKLISKVFKNSFASDEIFLPTLLMNSSFKDQVSPMMNLRYVDWKRGNPYIWQEHDFDELTNSNVFFARKFSYEHSPNIMEKIKAYLLG